MTSIAIELAGLNAVDEFTGLLRAGSCAGLLNDATFDLEPIEYNSYGSRTVLGNVLENLGGWSIALFYEGKTRPAEISIWPPENHEPRASQTAEPLAFTRYTS